MSGSQWNRPCRRLGQLVLDDVEVAVVHVDAAPVDGEPGARR